MTNWLVGKVASFYCTTLKVTEIFSKAILLPMFVYGDCMAVCTILYTWQQWMWLKKPNPLIWKGVHILLAMQCSNIAVNRSSFEQIKEIQHLVTCWETDRCSVHTHHGIQYIYIQLFVICIQLFVYTVCVFRAIDLNLSQPQKHNSGRRA